MWVAELHDVASHLFLRLSHISKVIRNVHCAPSTQRWERLELFGSFGTLSANLKRKKNDGVNRSFSMNPIQPIFISYGTCGLTHGFKMVFNLAETVETFKSYNCSSRCPCWQLSKSLLVCREPGHALCQQVMVFNQRLSVISSAWNDLKITSQGCEESISSFQVSFLAKWAWMMKLIISIYSAISVALAEL